MIHETECLDRVRVDNTVKYNGCLIYYTKGEWVFHRKGYYTIQLAKDAVDQSIIELQKEVKSVNQ